MKIFHRPRGERGGIIRTLFAGLWHVFRRGPKSKPIEIAF